MYFSFSFRSGSFVLMGVMELMRPVAVCLWKNNRLLAIRRSTSARVPPCRIVKLYLQLRQLIS